MIVKSDSCEVGWGAVLKTKPNKYAQKNEEQICRFSSGQYREKRLTSSIDQEILAVNYALDSFRLFFLNKKKYLLEQTATQLLNFSTIKISKESVENMASIQR